MRPGSSGYKNRNPLLLLRSALPRHRHRHDHATVAAQLKALTDLGWIDLVEAAHGLAADTFALTLPANV